VELTERTDGLLGVLVKHQPRLWCDPLPLPGCTCGWIGLGHLGHQADAVRAWIREDA